MEGGWTLAELVERAERALAGADVRAPNGRVTEVPDGRTIRWYATIGLLDRPTFRGRTARYGRRHLLQLVAVKRLQAGGRTLAQVQSELGGATDAVLAEIAGLAAEPDALPVAHGGAERGRFWATPALLPPAQHPAQAAEPAAERAAERAAEPVLYGVPIGAMTLLLPALPDEPDLAAIRVAAAPLLHLLATRGLLTPRAEGH